MLQVLTPREDLAGFEYRETWEEQQYRLQLETELERKKEKLIKRRINHPNEEEEVEDVLFDVVDAVCRDHDRVKKNRRELKKRKEREFWHPSCTQFKMKKLLNLEAEDGTKNVKISDFDFSGDLILTIS